MVELASSLFSFFFVFSLRFLGCGRRRETRFVFFCVAPQVACRQRSHAQIATSVLQSLFCTHSTWRRSRCNIKSQGGVFRTHSRWRRLLLWLRPSTGDTLRLLPRRAVGRLQTEISPADVACGFSALRWTMRSHENEHLCSIWSPVSAVLMRFQALGCVQKLPFAMFPWCFSVLFCDGCVPKALLKPEVFLLFRSQTSQNTLTADTAENVKMRR